MELNEICQPTCKLMLILFKKQRTRARCLLNEPTGPPTIFSLSCILSAEIMFAHIYGTVEIGDTN